MNEGGESITKKDISRSREVGLGEQSGRRNFFVPLSTGLHFCK
jgi:hypothetical protein